MPSLSRVPPSDEFHANISNHSAGVKVKLDGPQQQTDDWYASAGKRTSDLDL